MTGSIRSCVPKLIRCNMSKIIKCITVDDEFPALAVLKSHISKVPSLSLVAQFQDAVQALEFIQSHDIDLLFLDVQMPDINGMEFMSMLSTNPEVVFTTAHPEFALQGYDFNPIDYLLKPISFEKFMRAVTRAFSEHQRHYHHEHNSENRFIYIKSNGKTIRLNLSEITYIEGLKDYVIFYTESQHFISLYSMIQLTEKLPNEQFVRVHKSYIVALDKVEEIANNSLKIAGKSIPLGRHFKPELKKLLKDLKL